MIYDLKYRSRPKLLNEAEQRKLDKDSAGVKLMNFDSVYVNNTRINKLHARYC
jgi:hypothetical protein